MSPRSGLGDVDAPVRALGRSRNLVLHLAEAADLELRAELRVRGELALEHLREQVLEGRAQVRAHRRLGGVRGVERLEVLRGAVRLVDRALRGLVDPVGALEVADHGLAQLVALVVEQHAGLGAVEVREVVGVSAEGVVALQDVVEPDEDAQLLLRLGAQERRKPDEGARRLLGLPELVQASDVLGRGVAGLVEGEVEDRLAAVGLGGERLGGELAHVAEDHLESGAGCLASSSRGRGTSRRGLRCPAARREARGSCAGGCPGCRSTLAFSRMASVSTPVSWTLMIGSASSPILISPTWLAQLAQPAEHLLALAARDRRRIRCRG